MADKFSIPNRLRGEFRVMMSQLQSLQYDVCPGEESYRGMHPETIEEAGTVILHILPQLESVVKDICHRATQFIAERDNPPEAPEQTDTTLRFGSY